MSTRPEHDFINRGQEEQLSLFEAWGKLHSVVWIRSVRKGTETVAKVNISHAGGILADPRTFVLHCATVSTLGKCDCEDDELRINLEY